MENEPTDFTQSLETKQKITKRRQVVLCVILLILAYRVGYTSGQKGFEFNPKAFKIVNKNDTTQEVDYNLLWNTLKVVDSKFIEKHPNQETILYGAIKGAVASYGDPYTAFFEPKELTSFKTDLAGSFDGIGAEMGMKDKVLTIIAPLEGMPAEKAGLLAGDKVLKIDGEPTDALSLDAAVSKIRGKRGTEVKLTIYRDGESETRDITVTRDIINVKSVRIEDKKNGIELIRISRFGEDTTKEFQNALKDVIAVKPSGIVLDMRNNPGGLLNAAVDIAGEFLPKDAVVVIEEDAEKKRDSLVAKGANRLGAIPIVILINGGSASASEILAGALRDDRQDVQIVGETSFGKGSVQELIPVSTTTKVKITVAHWLTPSGKQINKVGIEPDVTVALTVADIEKKRDPQMDKALEILRAKKAAMKR
jgi:carboxyl-terminal processing protease